VRSPFLTPRWLGRHLLLVVSVVVMVRLGLWQWHRGGTATGSWTNYGYGVQWWLFAGFAGFLYLKAVLDELDPGRADRSADAEEPLVPIRQPQAAPPTDDEDDELAAYNRHLARLAENGRR